MGLLQGGDKLDKLEYDFFITTIKPEYFQQGLHRSADVASKSIHEGRPEDMSQQM
jgi:hypothetical protein